MIGLIALRLSGLSLTPIYCLKKNSAQHHTGRCMATLFQTVHRLAHTLHQNHLEVSRHLSGKPWQQR